MIVRLRWSTIYRHLSGDSDVDQRQLWVVPRGPDRHERTPIDEPVRVEQRQLSVKVVRVPDLPQLRDLRSPSDGRISERTFCRRSMVSTSTEAS